MLQAAFAGAHRRRSPVTLGVTGEDRRCAGVTGVTVKYRELPAEEEWRLGVIFEILEARQNNIGMDGLSRRDLEEILYYTCTV